MIFVVSVAGRAAAGPVRMRRWGAAVLAALALAGCDAGQSAGQSADPSAQSSAPAAPASATAPGATATASTAATGTATKSPGTGNVPVELVRTGGIAGQTEIITVKPDGSWERGSGRVPGRTGRLGADQVARLQALATDPQLDKEADRPLPTAVRCADTYSYLLMVNLRMIKYTECPSQADSPKVTKQIIDLLRDATAA